MERHKLHSILGRQIKRLLGQWEEDGLSREEILCILRGTYNDLAPREGQWQDKDAHASESTGATEE